MKDQYDAIVIGAGLTGLTTAFYLKKAGRKIAVIDKSERVGGVIKTIHRDGFIFETGPNTGVYSSAELVRLFDDLNGKVEPEFANGKSKQRWIWKNGAWHALPSGLGSAVKTPLFSLKDKFRILGEPFRKRGTNSFESVSELVKRRMGNSYLDYAVDPFISGIYAGNPDNLVTRFALPKLYNLEQNYGSFIRGSIKKRKEPKDDLTKRATREVFSVKGGLQSLTDALGEEIGKESIFLQSENLKISKAGDGYQAIFETGSTKKELKSNNIITTIGGNALDGIMDFIPAQDLDPIQNMTYAKVVQVIAAYKNWEGISLGAFGGLFPSVEKRDALGILFTSSIFSGRTPVGGAVLSVFMGGMRNPGLIKKSDQEILELAMKEIEETLKPGAAKPDHLEIFRYTHAIPQYDASSELKLKAIHKIESENPGLWLGGNIRDGIGMADRVKQGYDIASEVILHQR